MRRGRIVPLLAAALIACGAATAAASTAGLVEQGNRACDAGKYDEALKLYGKASVDAPESDVICFNRGVAYFRKGDFARARKLFEQAAIKSRNLRLEARSQYNLGNCEVRDARRRADSDLEKCMQGMRRAIEHYRRALKLDPGLRDAAHNLEVTRIKLKQMLDELKRRQEQQRKQARKNRQQRKKSGAGKQQSGQQQKRQGKRRQGDGKRERQRKQARTAGGRSRSGAGKQERRRVQTRPRGGRPGPDPRRILEEERENRRQRQQASSAGYVPVDKDW